ncbi:MAG: hypothetical protein K2U26_08570, partial [Cyclobacteriaceae bacterium]|nr:hypothetical protein [Cyclobacteriaceae bacterium]
NATLGAIVRPIDFFQFGLSIATPTGYQITDNYVAAMSTAWKNFEYTPGRFLNNESASTDNVTSSYGLSTPWRLSGGATFFIQKKGFISVDIERFNYGSTKYNSTTTGVSYSEDNNEIRGLYRSVFNIRVGGEYRYDKFRFRAGYSMMPDPFQVEQNGVSRAWTTYTAGLGYRTSKFYVDVAAVLGQGSNSYRPYRVPTPTSPLVTQNNKSTTILVTLGFPF